MPAINPAVLDCASAYEKTFAIERGKGATKFDASLAAAEAYRKAMPTFTSRDSVFDFIACVTHAMNLQIIVNDDGNRLLHGAGMALRGLPSPSKMPKNRQN